MNERYLSLAEACEVLGKSERTLYRWIKSGKLKAFKPGRDYEIPVSAIREMRERSVVRPKAESAPPLDGAQAVGLGPSAADHARALGLEPDPAITDVPLPTLEVEVAHEAAVIRLLRAEQRGLRVERRGRDGDDLSSFVLALAKVVAALPDGADKDALQECTEAMMARAVAVFEKELARVLAGTPATAA